jgi:aspartate-semialdehyde dehydrogenase
MRLALVGATGLVGNEMIKVLEERLSDKITEFIPVASAKSVCLHFCRVAFSGHRIGCRALLVLAHLS